MDLTTKVSLVRGLKENKFEKIFIKSAAKLLGVDRTSIYYKGRLANDEKLTIMDPIDRMHTEHPTWALDSLRLNSETLDTE